LPAIAVDQHEVNISAEGDSSRNDVDASEAEHAPSDVSSSEVVRAFADGDDESNVIVQDSGNVNSAEALAFAPSPFNDSLSQKLPAVKVSEDESSR
jgi:hypothetical protein